jgi:hypothetical protein
VPFQPLDFVPSWEKPMKRLLLVLTLVAGPVTAQSSGTSPIASAPSWSGAVGLSRVADPLGFSLHASLTRRHKSRSLRLSLDNASNIKSTVTLNAASLSLGGHIGDGPLDVSLFVGPAVVWGKEGFNDAGFALEREFSTVGANFDLEAMLRLGSRVRFGAAAWANANSTLNAVGVGPRLQIRFR